MEEIREKLREIILGIFEVEVEPEVTVAPEGMPADFASNVAMKLAGRLHSAPMEIAGKIKEKIEEDGGAGFLVEVARPGFLNFRMKDEFFIEKLGEMRENFAEAMRIDKHKGELVICEFSDPNPFKVLHVGHLFTTVIGDAVARLYERAGAKVVRANFGGDIGMHVAKTMFILQRKRMDRRMSATEVVEMIAKCYVEGTRAYEDNVFSKMEITAINKFLYQVVEAGEDAEWERAVKIQTDEGEVEIQGKRIAKMYWWGRKASYEYFDEFYKILGVKFDKYYPESSVMKRGIAEVSRGLKEGVFEKSNGAVVFLGEKYGLHTRVFINREGLPTYEAKDFGLGLTKWEDYKFDENVVITGNDIIEYMKVIFKAEELVEPEVAKRSRHIAHGNLKLLGGVKMSSRKGNFVTAEEVIEAVKDELQRETGSEDMRVVMAAIKFAFLKNKLEGNTNFDIHSSVRM
ncbi:MAG: arginine--tRNA ligase, partial [Candidatus Saccharibacteria bacterium]|nr:arginine--tRNA ligase [Candidatus Saccharibacteria bacterium]